LLKGLFRTKNLDDILATLGEQTHSLKRTLGPLNITLLGIGAIIGAGIFATVGTAAAGDAVRPGAGPSLMLSFTITAVVCAFTALCYAEMAAMVPISGSAYTYSYATLGELVAWIIGWDLILEYAIGNVAVAISWANYFRSLMHDALGIDIPQWLSTDFRTARKIPGLIEQAPHIFGIPIVFNLLAFGIVALITIVLVWGIKESAEFNAVMVGVKIIVLLFFIATALVIYIYFNPQVTSNFVSVILIYVLSIGLFTATVLYLGKLHLWAVVTPKGIAGKGFYKPDLPFLWDRLKEVGFVTDKKNNLYIYLSERTLSEHLKSHINLMSRVQTMIVVKYDPELLSEIKKQYEGNILNKNIVK